MMSRACLMLAALVFPLVFSLSGCGEEPTPPPRPVVTKTVTKPESAKTVVSSTQEKVPEASVYVYNPAGKRDPFQSPVQALKVPAPSELEPLTPLQQFDLGQLRIVGVIVGKGEATAMVIVPGGKSFILRKGVKVGKNQGVVVKITPESVQIEEKYYDFSGEVRKTIQEIRLPIRGGV